MRRFALAPRALRLAPLRRIAFWNVLGYGETLDTWSVGPGVLSQTKRISGGRGDPLVLPLPGLFVQFLDTPVFVYARGKTSPTGVLRK